jgi:quercetin dioxygenase-like cupin family protein
MAKPSSTAQKQGKLAMPWLEHIEKLPLKEIFPGFKGRFLHSDNMTFVFWEIDAGCDLPEHNHPHEQVAHVLGGQFEMSLNGEKRVLKAGSVTVIPSYAMHGGKAITACRILDVFSPKREDYASG